MGKVLDLIPFFLHLPRDCPLVPNPSLITLESFSPPLFPCYASSCQTSSVSVSISKEAGRLACLELTSDCATPSDFNLTHTEASSIQETMGGHNSIMYESERGEDEQEINNKRQDKMLWDKKLNDAILRFLKEFPNQREEIEECIRCLRERTDTINKTHRACKIASFTSSSGGAVSGIMSIVGLALAPFTVGASLILTATGIGVGAAAAATGTGARVSECVICSKEKKVVEKLIRNCEERLRRVLSLDKIGCISGLHSDGKATVEARQDDILLLFELVAEILDKFKKGRKNREHLDALVKAQDLPNLAELAKKATSLKTEAQIAIQGIDQVDEAFKGTARAMRNGTRVLGIVVSGLLVAVDVCFIVANSIELASGAKTEAAAKIRDTAHKFEAAVQTLKELHEELKDLWE